jgi:copper(I)-binding protein
LTRVPAGRAATAVLACLAIVCVAAALACSGDDDRGRGQLSVSDAWAAEGTDVTAVYLRVDNPGPPDHMVAAETPAARSVAVMAETSGTGIHTAAPGPVDVQIPTGGIHYAPGEGHVMLSELAEPLRPGDHIDLTLTFERNGRRTVDVEILSWDQVVERNERG